MFKPTLEPLQAKKNQFLARRSFPAQQSDDVHVANTLARLHAKSTQGARDSDHPRSSLRGIGLVHPANDA